MAFTNHAGLQTRQSGCVPLVTVAKIRAPGEDELLWEIPGSCSKAKQERKGGIHWPTFPESTFVASL